MSSLLGLVAAVTVETLVIAVHVRLDILVLPGMGPVIDKVENLSLEY